MEGFPVFRTPQPAGACLRSQIGVPATEPWASAQRLPARKRFGSVRRASDLPSEFRRRGVNEVESIQAIFQLLCILAVAGEEFRSVGPMARLQQGLILPQRLANAGIIGRVTLAAIGGVVPGRWVAGNLQAALI